MCVVHSKCLITTLLLHNLCIYIHAHNVFMVMPVYNWVTYLRWLNFYIFLFFLLCACVCLARRILFKFKQKSTCLLWVLGFSQVQFTHPPCMYLPVPTRALYTYTHLHTCAFILLDSLKFSYFFSCFSLISYCFTLISSCLVYVLVLWKRERKGKRH